MNKLIASLSISLDNSETRANEYKKDVDTTKDKLKILEKENLQLKSLNEE